MGQIRQQNVAILVPLPSASVSWSGHRHCALWTKPIITNLTKQWDLLVYAATEADLTQEQMHR